MQSDLSVAGFRNILEIFCRAAVATHDFTRGKPGLISNRLSEQIAADKSDLQL